MPPPATRPVSRPSRVLSAVWSAVWSAVRVVFRHVILIALFAIPAVVLWWHVWSGHPSSTLTCGCGDPAQQVWFTAWPAYALAHLHSLVFSGAVNVPDGANLLSNTSGTLVGVLLAPVTWTAGPIAATNVALTLAPALSGWACFLALRPLVRWRPAAVVGGLVFGYSSAIVTSLYFGHVSVTWLVVPPLLFTLLHEIVIRQQRSVLADGLALAALLVVQFLISPEVLVMCALFTVVGLLAVTAVGWRQLRARAGHALPALALGVGIGAVLLAYPAWFGVAGPQAVTGKLFFLAPVLGAPFSGLILPGAFNARGTAFVRYGGYLGQIGPPSDYLGPGLVAVAAALVVGRRRPIVWLLLFLAVVAAWLSLGAYLTGAPPSWARVWLPWHSLYRLPILKQIIPDQFSPFIPLFVAFLLAIGLDAFAGGLRRWRWAAAWGDGGRQAAAWLAALVVALLAVVPVFATVDVPLTVESVRLPAYMRDVAPTLPSGTVLLTIPFAVSGIAPPMLWQAVDDMHFRLAGAAMKTPNATGGPVGQGAPGSTRRILTNLSQLGEPLPAGTAAQLLQVRRAVQRWQVDRVVISGTSRDPVFASGFLTKALGFGPTYVDGAYVWTLPPGPLRTSPAAGASLARCRVQAGAPAERGNPLGMSQCVLAAAGRA
jgi:hypothetical protein